MFFVHFCVLKCGKNNIEICVNPVTPNDLSKRLAMSPIKIKIPNSNVREKPTNTPIINYVW
jgi:hypothetical protein